MAASQQNDIRQLKKTYLDCFTSVSGKKVLADLESKCFANRTTYSTERGGIYRNEGMRFVVVYIKNMMKMDIKKLEALTQEEE